VLLLDVEMPGPGARAVIRALHVSHPDTDVIVLTMHDSAGVVRDLLQCGAAAYLVKNIAREQLVAAVRSVSRNRENVILSVPRGTMDAMDPPVAPDNPLSARELEVLRLVAKALSNAQIATELFISEGTVKRHLTNIYAKLDAVSRVDAIKKASAANLIAGLEP
jgi:DNA-binding NarL/FixJ family response regulator